MATIRVFYNGDTVLGTEHRADQTYTDANRPTRYLTDSWFEADSSICKDGLGAVPFECLAIDNSGARPVLSVDSAMRDSYRQAIKDRTRGAGGRLDVLYDKLRDGTITVAEQTEMLRLERNL